MAMTRAEFNRAFQEVIALEFAEIPMEENSITYTFSDSFVKKMDKLIEKQKKMYWSFINTAGKRVAVIAIAFLTMMMALLSVDEIRASMLRWCVERYEEYKEYFFEGDTTKEITYEYQLTYVPEGFDFKTDAHTGKTVVAIYKNDDGDEILLKQSTTEGRIGSTNLEDAIESVEIIRGIEVYIYDHEGYVYADWVEDGYYMFIQYTGCEDINVLKKVIEEIQ